MSPIDLDVIRFPGQQSDERVFLFLRRHWISFVGPVLMVVVMVLLPIIMTVFLRYLTFDMELVLVDLFKGFDSIDPALRAKQMLVFMYSAYYFFVASYFLVLWLDYYFDITIVTNERIIDISQLGLFNRVVSELYLTQIQDVSGNQKGILQSVFHYGDVIIQTAGGKNNFCIDHVNNSYQVARKIVDLQEALIERRDAVDDAVKVA